MRRRLAPWIAVLTLVAAATVARSDEPRSISECQHTLQTSTDPVARVAAVRRLAEIGSSTVPTRLGRVVRHDVDPALRIAAAQALGRVDIDGAALNVLNLIVEGGPQKVREALARTSAKLGTSPTDLAERIDDPRADRSARLLLIEAIGAHPSPLAAAQLEFLAAAGRPSLRAAALLALAGRDDGRDLVAAPLLDLLARDEKDIDIAVDVVELAGAHGDAKARALLESRRADAPEVVLAAIDNAVARIRARESRSTASEQAPRARHGRDVVHVFHQGRGSQLGRLMSAVRSDLRSAQHDLEDVRVGVVSYMEPTASVTIAAQQILPLTRDEKKVTAFFQKLRGQVSIQRGVGLSTAIVSAYGRSDWRWDAKRTVVVHAGIGPADKHRGRAAAAAHFAADSTRIRVLYYAGARIATADISKDGPPRSLKRLAEAGGADPETGRPTRRPIEER